MNIEKMKVPMPKQEVDKEIDDGIIDKNIPQDFFEGEAFAFFNLPELDLNLAKKAMEEEWVSTYGAHPDEPMLSEIPVGKIDLHSKGLAEPYNYWASIMCEDGISRNIPMNIFPQIEEENKRRKIAQKY